VRYLITGGSGYIGSRLVSHLIGREQTDEIVIADVREPRDWRPKTSFRRLDVRDKHAVDELLQAERPEADPRSIHRFRRATEPWAVDALAFLGAPELSDAVEEARRNQPAEPLLRGDELGLPAGPEIGRLLAEIAEEQAAGTIATKEEALEYARRNARAVREDG